MNPTFKELEPSQRQLEVPVLEKLKSQFEIFNFEGETGSAKITKPQYIMLCIEHLLNVAKVNKWDICKNEAYIYIYNEKYWEILDKELFKQFLTDVAIKMGVHRIQAMYHGFSAELYSQFDSVAYLPMPEPQVGKTLVNLQNGTCQINEQGISILGYNPVDFLTYQLPFSYNPKASAPTFTDFLNKVLPDKSAQMVLAEYAGYIFTHGLKLEKALILFGSGANGKSVFFDIISALVGEANISNYSLQSLTDENGYHRAQIGNKLVNYASEINGKLEASFFKQLVSNEPIEARLPYCKPFVMKRYAKLIFNCNEYPKEVEQTHAFFRRFLIIPFTVTIPEKEQDKMLSQKIIKNELEGVFNWVLEGLGRILKNRAFTNCDASTNATAEFRLNSDAVSLFLEETHLQKTLAGTSEWLEVKDIYMQYKQYCIEGSYGVLNKSNFKKRLQNLGIVVERKSFGYVAFLKKKMEEEVPF